MWIHSHCINTRLLRCAVFEKKSRGWQEKQHSLYYSRLQSSGSFILHQKTMRCRTDLWGHGTCDERSGLLNSLFIFWITHQTDLSHMSQYYLVRTEGFWVVECGSFMLIKRKFAGGAWISFAFGYVGSSNPTAQFSCYPALRKWLVVATLLCISVRGG